MGAVTSVDEEYLVRRIARGDRGAFEELYRRTSPWLAVRLRRRCADDELVAEVMQETYLAGVAGRGGLRRVQRRWHRGRLGMDDRGPAPG